VAQLVRQGRQLHGFWVELAQLLRSHPFTVRRLERLFQLDFSMPRFATPSRRPQPDPTRTTIAISPDHREPWTDDTYAYGPAALVARDRSITLLARTMGYVAATTGCSVHRQRAQWVGSVSLIPLG
jgi:hypothetical protein